MTTQVMIDLETLGTKPGSVIVSLGAVKFGGGQIHSEFYERIDAANCMNLGLKIDPATVMWWMNQADDVRKEITQPGALLAEVLCRFTEWMNDPDAEVWGNGAAFDNVLLTEAYDKAGLPRPWKWFNDRCYRTIKNLRPDVQMMRIGKHHNALEDARSQAIHLMSLLHAMRG